MRLLIFTTKSSIEAQQRKRKLEALSYKNVQIKQEGNKWHVYADVPEV